MEMSSIDEGPEAIGPYTRAVVSGGVVDTSGEIAIDPSNGAIVAGGIEEQTERVCRNVEALLEAAGTDISKVVKTVCFRADMRGFAAFNAVYAKHFVSKPARRSFAGHTPPHTRLLPTATGRVV